MKVLLLIFTGGGIGSLLRFATSRYFNPVFAAFPLGTFLSNFISSLIVGIVVGLSMEKTNSEFLKYFVVVGLCGGYSTFSGFSNETFQLIRQDNYQYALLNIFLNVMLCLAAIFAGVKMSKLV
ncbi:MAG: fluoride efflux transporter CrcB [Cytophagaceae bacterium]|nr:fluoride efflux transporter CrcB [Cytophagaceae bacterium]